MILGKTKRGIAVINKDGDLLEIEYGARIALENRLGDKLFAHKDYNGNPSMHMFRLDSGDNDALLYLFGCSMTILLPKENVWDIRRVGPYINEFIVKLKTARTELTIVPVAGS